MTFSIDRQLYPFESRYLDLPAGRLHYVDEGDVILMVHGTPPGRSYTGISSAVCGAVVG